MEPRTTLERANGKRAFRRGCPSDEFIIIQEHLSEGEAFEAEKFLIAYYGRKANGGLLKNLTDGGEGVAGLLMSTESKKKMSGRKKNRTLSTEHRAKLADAQRRRWQSVEARVQQSLKSTGRKLSPEAREKMRQSKLGNKNPQYGKPKTEAWIAIISSVNKGNQYAKGTKRTEEWKEAASLRMMGNTFAARKEHYGE